MYDWRRAGKGMNVHVIAYTDRTQHDANDEPAEGPDGDERRRTTARHRGQTPQRTQEDPQETSFQKLAFPTCTHTNTQNCDQTDLYEWKM